MSRLRCSFAFIGLCLLAGFSSLPAMAGVVIDGTRVVYHAKDREVTVGLTNDDKAKPRMVQVWIDNGDEKLTPDKADVPFNLTPPIFRMEPGESRSLRIAYTKEPLPTDKESLFWLNVLEVPPKSFAGDSQNTLRFAFRIRIKLFFRPSGLPGTALEAPKQLTWSLVKEGSRTALEAHNPTPYYVSFQSVALETGGKLIKSNDIDTLAPGGTRRFALEDNVGPATAGAEVQFSAISDWGAFIPFTASLKP